jgi:hypothetical protein
MKILDLYGNVADIVLATISRGGLHIHYNMLYQ